MTDSLRQYQCPWCGQRSDATSMSCPFCGSPIDVRAAVSKSGWSELPPIKDMTKIQFNQSLCQVAGKFVPVADFKLAAEDRIYFGHRLLLWKDEQVKINLMKFPLWRIFDRLFAGMPLVMAQATGPGRVAFSKDIPGELIAIPLQAEQSIDVREHVFMLATHSVDYDWFSSNIWFTTKAGKDTSTHYPVGRYIDRFTATNGPGFLLLHGGGHVFFRQLETKQSILIKPTSLLFKETTVQMHLHVDHPAGIGPGLFRRHIWLRLVGPGRVAVQSQFNYMGCEQAYLVSIGPQTTEKQW